MLIQSSMDKVQKTHHSANVLFCPIVKQNNAKFQMLRSINGLTNNNGSWPAVYLESTNSALVVIYYTRSRISSFLLSKLVFTLVTDYTYSSYKNMSLLQYSLDRS